jgi:hypothetical protein
LRPPIDPVLSTILQLQSTPTQEELKLIEKTQKYARLVSWIPGLRMMALCNSLSMYASDPDSDIDLFIVSNPGRIWLVRGLITGIFHILGVRRHGEKVVGRFCLSFFITTNVLDMSQIALEKDPYLEAWAYHLMPILDRGDVYSEFV